MEMKQISIGLSVAKIIEENRKSFSESENDILERLLTGNKIKYSTDNNSKAIVEYYIPSNYKKDIKGAWAKEVVGGFMVKKGSTISRDVTKSLSPGYKKLRDTLIATNVIDFTTREFLKDYVFTSRSAASCVVLGTSSDGHRDWLEKE